MLQYRKQYVLGLIGVVIIVVVAGFFFGDRIKKLSDSLVSFVINSTKTFFSIETVVSEVTVQDDGGITKSVDISSGKIEDADALERRNFSNFSGLPKLGVNGTKDIEQDFVIVSGDKSKAIVTIVTYDTQTETAASGIPQAMLNKATYICDISQKKCTLSDILSRQYQGLDLNPQSAVGSLWWSAWDSTKNILYGYLVSGSLGSISPVYACNVGNGICSKTEGFDSQKSGGTRAIVPNGAFSPSLGKFVMVAQNDTPNEDTGKTWQLLLYSSSDLSKPLKTYDITAAIDYDESVAYDSVQSVAWSGDEKKIAIGTERRIFMFDTETGGLSIAYVAPPNEDGDAYWDSSALFMTLDAKYLAFVDESDFVQDVDPVDASADQEDGISINTLKKIDLENANIVGELLRGPSLNIVR
jgi:hypothetical protein